MSSLLPNYGKYKNFYTPVNPKDFTLTRAFGREWRRNWPAFLGFFSVWGLFGYLLLTKTYTRT
jgi:hypothetical protein